MRCLENNPTTLPQTATILAGQSVGGISVFDLLQVKNYGDGAKCLSGLINEGKFELSIPTACLIHKYVGREDALEWGVMRNASVSLHKINFVPPTKDLESIVQRGFYYLATQISDPIERAIGVFLFMSRTQPFYDANKRTASLMMNGVLMNEGYFPITVLNQNSEEFHRKLGEFYETGDADPMFEFFRKSILEIYSQEQRKAFQVPQKN